MKTGYSIKTWRMRLFCPEQDMLAKTEQLYQETVDFYYEILQTRQDIWKENLLSIQRELELLTVPGRDGRVPLYTPPHGKLPVYFRRSAMNKAGIAVKSAAVVGENQKKEIVFPEKIDASLTFFKGMYRDISDTSIKLKLWDGKKWKWISSQLEGRPFPVNGTVLSPSLSHNGKLLIRKIWHDKKMRGRGVTEDRAKTLVEAAHNSVGLDGGIGTKSELYMLLEEHRLWTSQLEAVNKVLEEMILKVPHVEKLLAIKGVGSITIAGFIAEVGDIRRFDSPKQIQKYAGLKLVENSSGKHKGRTRISKRGRRKLRKILYQVMVPLLARNKEFRGIYDYYVTRVKNPLKRRQAMVAVSCKLIRVFYAVLTKGVEYDRFKMMSDIHRKSDIIAA